MAETIGVLNNLKRLFSFKKKTEENTDTFSGISFFESYDTDAYAIEDIESYYKIITKISAIPKSLIEISQSIISQKYIIQNKKTEEEIENIPPELELLIEQPYRHYNYNEFISLIITDLLIAGNIFVYLVKDEQTNRLALRRIDPQYIEIQNGQWIENHPTGAVEYLDEKFLIHVKYTPDPWNPKWGKGIIANNVTLFTNIMRMLEFRENFYKRGCFPSGVFSVEDSGGAVNDSKIKQEIKTNYQSSKRAGGPLILLGKVSYHQIQLDPATLKMSEELTLLYKEVMIAFGMPRYLMELGLRDTGQKFNNHEKQREHYIKTTIVPIARKIEAVFNDVLARYSADIEFKYSINDEVYSENTLQNMVEIGSLTPNEQRQMLNIPASEDELLDKHYTSAGRGTLERASEGMGDFDSSPQDDETMPQKPEKPEEPPEDKKPKDKVPNGKARGKSWRDASYLSEPEDNIWQLEEIKRDVNIKRIRQDFETINGKTRRKKTKEFVGKFSDYLTEQYIGFMTAMQKNEKLLEKITKPEGKAEGDKEISIYLGKIYKAKEETGKIARVGTVLYQSVGSATFSNTENILTIDVPFSMKDPGVAAKVNLLRETTVKVADSTLNQIEAVVRRGVENNSTAAEVAKDMWRHFVDEEKELPDSFTISSVTGRRMADRASTIARNEVNRANRLFGVESMKKSGVVKSIQLVGEADADEHCTPFFNQNFPYEMADELSNIHVNCRCTIVPGEISID